MLKVLEYYFENDPEFGPKLAVVRAGSGHQDLANDLQLLADLYEDDSVDALVRRDPKHYSADDPKRARDIATQIFVSLGLGSNASELNDLTQRAWTLLNRSYEKVRRAGQYVFAEQEDVDLTYPTLVGYVRSPAVRPGTPDPKDPNANPAKADPVSG